MTEDDWKAMREEEESSLIDSFNAAVKTIVDGDSGTKIKRITIGFTGGVGEDETTDKSSRAKFGK